MTMIRTTACAALLALGAVSTAHADGRAWAAIEKRVPASAFVAGGFNLGAMRGSKLFKSLPALIDSEGDTRKMAKLIKTYCKVDALAAIDDIAFAMGEDATGDEEGVIVVAFKNFDQVKFDTCLRKAAKAEEKLTVSTTQIGDLTEYAAQGEPDKLYIAWLAKDVMAIALEGDEKVMLQKFIGGSGAGPGLAALTSRTNPKAAVWAAFAKDTDVDGLKLKAAWGTVNLVKGAFVLDGHVSMASARDAQTMAGGISYQVKAWLDGAPAGPLKTMLASVTAVATGADVTIGAKAADQKASDVMKALDKIF